MTRFDLKVLAIIIVVLLIVVLVTSCGVVGDIAPNETLPPLTVVESGSS